MAPPELLIRFHCGPAAGRQARFTTSPLVFGRDPALPLCLPEPFVSRRHGEIVCTDQAWTLLNHSDNGTRVNGKLLLAGEQRTLVDGDEITIGKQLWFTVGLPSTGAGASAASAAPAPAVRPRGKGRLWIMLGIWWVLLLGGVIFFYTLSKHAPGPQDSANEPAPLTNEQIEKTLLRPLAPQPPSDSEYRRHIEEARALAAALQAARSNLYKAYRAYLEAQAVADKHALADALDQLTFTNLQQAIVQQTQERYHRAYNRLRSSQFPAAAEEFATLGEDLRYLYDLDRNNALYQNVLQMQQLARQHLKKTGQSFKP